MKNSFRLIVIFLLLNFMSSAQKVTHQQLEELVKKGDIVQLKSIVLKDRINVNEVAREKNELPLLFAACNGDNIEILQFLLEQGANPNAISRYGMPAHWAAQNGNLPAIDILLDYGFDPKKETLEYWVGKYKKKDSLPILMKELADYVVEKKLSVQDLPYTEYTDPGDPLILSSAIHYDSTGKLELAKRLIKAGSNVNLVDKTGKTALFVAIQDFNVKAVELLIKKGSDVNKAIKNERMFELFKRKEFNDNITPLHFVIYMVEHSPEVFQEHKEEAYKIVKLLLKAGADPNIETFNDHKNVVQKAVVIGDVKLLEILSEK